MDFIDPPITVEPRFKCKKAFMDADGAAEFDRQLSLQESTMNGMDVHRWLQNRKNFLKGGRSAAGTKKQKDTMDAAYAAFRASVIADRKALYMGSAYKKKAPEALAMAEAFVNRLLAYTLGKTGRRKFKNSQWTDAKHDGKTFVNALYKKAALHALDQVAGGEGDDIVGLGGSREDFSLGAQWKGARVDGLEVKVKKEVKGRKADEQKNIRMNVKLMPPIYE